MSVGTGILIGGGKVAHCGWTDSSYSFRSIWNQHSPTTHKRNGDGYIEYVRLEGSTYRVLEFCATNVSE